MTARRRSREETFFKVGIWLKGVNGALELLVGSLLLFSPHRLLNHGVAILVAHGGRAGIGGLFDQAGSSLARVETGFSFPVFYLLSHGVVKLFLAICLLRDARWAYPVSLGVFGLLLAYELYRVATQPSLLLGAVIAIDMAILTLLYRHWRKA